MAASAVVAPDVTVDQRDAWVGGADASSSSTADCQTAAVGGQRFGVRDQQVGAVVVPDPPSADVYLRVRVVADQKVFTTPAGVGDGLDLHRPGWGRRCTRSILRTVGRRRFGGEALEVVREVIDVSAIGLCQPALYEAGVEQGAVGQVDVGEQPVEPVPASEVERQVHGIGTDASAYELGGHRYPPAGRVSGVSSPMRRTFSSADGPGGGHGIRTHMVSPSTSLVTIARVIPPTSASA